MPGQKPRKAKLITVSGDHYSAGYNIGRKTASSIIKVLERSKESVKKQDPLLRRRLAEKFLKFSEKAAQDPVAELRGMADGAGVSFKQLFAFNLKELETLAKPRGRESENCTTVIIPKKDRILAGHNEDGDRNNDLFVLKAKIGDDPKFLALCYYGWLPGAAATVNSSGIFQTINNIFATDVRIGTPLLLHAREALRATSIEEAESIITGRRRARGENFIFYKGSRCVNIETSATRHKAREIKKPFAHTNHYIERSMLDMQRKIEPSKASTKKRLGAAKGLLAGHDFRKPDSLKKILADHQNAPRSICLHKFLHLKTLGSVLFDTSKKELKVSKGLPCKAKFFTYRL